MNHRVVITNGVSLIALAVARSLSRHGVQVTLIADRAGTPVSSSASVAQTHVLPSPVHAQDEYLQALEDILRKNSFDAFFPIGTEDTLLISKYRERFSTYCAVPFSPYKKLYALHNKKILAGICKSIGLRIPETTAPARIEEIEHIAGRLSYPAVIKLQDATGAKGVAFAEGPGELKDGYIRMVNKHSLDQDRLPIIQEYINGTGYGVSCLYNQGKLRAFFSHKRIREVSPSGGASTCREGIRNREMEEMAFALLDHAAWHGVAMVEFKWDEKEGKPVILEVNPRFWGSLHTAIVSGVDFPWLLLQMAVTGDISPATDYRTGLRSRCLLTDMVSLARHLRHGSLSLPYMMDFLGFHKEKTYLEDLSWHDPKPFFSFLIDKLYH